MNSKDASGENGGFDPGAMRFGNFINYYQFHPPAERIRLLPEKIWEMIRLDDAVLCLDVGCNCGDLTESIHEILQAQTTTPRSTKPSQTTDNKQLNLLGIDIDSTLIDRANEKNRHDNIKYECLDIMEPHALEYLESYLLHLQSTIPINLSETLSYMPVRKFNIVFCFSVTMWIHLNHGDAGLFEFLRKIVSLGKYIVMENQPWKCYRNAQRRMVRNAIQKKRNDLPGKKNEEKYAVTLTKAEEVARKSDESLVNKSGENIADEIAETTDKKHCKRKEKRELNLYKSVKDSDNRLIGNIMIKKVVSNDYSSELVVSRVGDIIIDDRPNRNMSNIDKEDCEKRREKVDNRERIGDQTNESANVLSSDITDDSANVLSSDETNDCANVSNSDKTDDSPNVFSSDKTHNSANVLSSNEKDDGVNVLNSDTEYKIDEKKVRSRRRQGGRDKKATEEEGFKHYRELKLRSNVDKEIDAFLREKCNARRLYESGENEWGRVITLYETL